jgi:hypothetical protein
MSKKVLLISFLLITFVRSFSAQQAEAATFTISDKASCEAVGGSLSSTRCTIFDSLTITQSDTLIVSVGIVLVLEEWDFGTGTLENFRRVTYRDNSQE